MDLDAVELIEGIIMCERKPFPGPELWSGKGMGTHSSTGGK